MMCVCACRVIQDDPLDPALTAQDSPFHTQIQAFRAARSPLLLATAASVHSLFMNEAHAVAIVTQSQYVKVAPVRNDHVIGKKSIPGSAKPYTSALMMLLMQNATKYTPTEKIT